MHSWRKVSDQLHFGDKPNSLTAKPQIEKFSAFNLTQTERWKDHAIWSKCPPWALTQAERRWRHWLMAATTIKWSGFLHSTKVLCFSSARRHCNKTSQIRVLHRLHCKCNCTCVLSRLGNKSSKFYNVSSVLNKITGMLKMFWFCFFVDTEQNKEHYKHLKTSTRRKVSLPG